MSAHAPMHWNAEGLWRQLRPMLGDLGVEVLHSVGSTNTALLERARQSAGRRQANVIPYLLVAESQTRGRGRLGREWHSQAGASLTFSFGMPYAPADWSGLSLAVGVALADALEPDAATPPRLALKWPNDLWLRDPQAPAGGRKLGGILVETVGLGERRLCVVGVGLNITGQRLPGALSHGQADVSELQPGITAPQALHQVAVPLVLALLRFQAEGFAPFAAAFDRRDLLKGQPVTTTSANLPAGLALGVDAHGALLVSEPEAPYSVRALTSGEVSVRLQPGGPA